MLTATNTGILLAEKKWTANEGANFAAESKPLPEILDIRF